MLSSKCFKPNSKHSYFHEPQRYWLSSNLGTVDLDMSCPYIYDSFDALVLSKKDNYDQHFFPFLRLPNVALDAFEWRCHF